MAGYELKPGYIYSIRIPSEAKMFERITFVGSYYALKGDIFNVQQQEKEISDLEWTKYPVFLFYNKATGFIIYNSLKQFIILDEIKFNKEISIDSVNRLVLSYLKRDRRHNLFNNIFIKNFLFFSKVKDETFKRVYATKAKKKKIKVKL